MILTCESCSTQFSVSAEQLGAAGRRVKCSRCGNSWFQKPDAAEVPPSAEAAAPAAAAQASPAEEALAEPRRRNRPPVVIAEKPKAARLSHKLAAVAMLMIGAVLQTILILHYLGAGGTLLAGIGLRDSSSFRFEPLAFETLPGQGEKFTLALNGRVKNISDEAASAPPVRIALFDMHGRQVSELDYQFPEGMLAAGETASFQPKINNIPSAITRVKLDIGNSLERALR